MLIGRSLADARDTQSTTQTPPPPLWRIKELITHRSIIERVIYYELYFCHHYYRIGTPRKNFLQNFFRYEKVFKKY